MSLEPFKKWAKYSQNTVKILTKLNTYDNVLFSCSLKTLENQMLKSEIYE